MKRNENLINNWRDKISEYMKKNEKKTNWEEETKKYIEEELLLSYEIL